MTSWLALRTSANNLWYVPGIPELLVVVLSISVSFMMSILGISPLTAHNSSPHVSSPSALFRFDPSNAWYMPELNIKRLRTISICAMRRKSYTPVFSTQISKIPLSRYFVRNEFRPLALGGNRWRQNIIAIMYVCNCLSALRTTYY